MALASTLARDWILEVRPVGGSTWTRVRGLSSVAPIFEGAEQDASDIDSDGYSSPIITGLSYRIEGGGKRKGDNTAGFVDDPGQNFLRRQGRITGADNFIEARIYRRDELPDAYQSTNIVKWTDTAAGDPNALQEFSFTLGGVGKPEEIVKPPITGGSAKTFNVSFGGATAGNATLTWNGKTTANIASSAANTAVASALGALDDGYDASDFTVTGSAGSYVVTVPHGTLTGSGSGLTGGTLTITPA
ncbi:phage tail tube protein [Prescottella equi]|uniref:Major tail protein n=1 Tax=Rhodococcus phage REQ3 TaxID=1109714 RepID=G9FH93_9CAUD|nr:hypothetical protein [Prescottella equi]YP_005087238.1 major tail protein [Rhodococcus phage REQ3]AEV51982.1 hypothetical protein [Rhodococcus phage REQ3]ERN43243.1 hypothetical protein H849_24279 [Prescottella equi NBRC 101255 = C 7]ORL29073.1 hypothetical protein A6I89_01960 [Prescottella equi]QPQ77261.1 hypothetical protein I6H09_00005 [Prescottella equi]SUE04888.1 Uncharacterised protein [Prescottella equi]